LILVGQRLCAAWLPYYPKLLSAVPFTPVRGRVYSSIRRPDVKVETHVLIKAAIDYARQ